MTAPTPSKAPRQARKDVYIARLVIKVPIDMTNSETLGAAIKAVAGIKNGLPEGSTVEHTAKPTFGKA